jgi:BirA family transcriptional regulator, biotin operon repressor / biotin---[acetyl-CoA-carboxylase] ligase
MADSQPTTTPPRIELLDEIGSTNDEAQQRAAAGERGPLWIATRRQTAGKGRSGRAWSEASTGNVAATLLFEPGCAPARLPELSLLAGVAAHAAITDALPAATQSRVELKWPNDVLITGAKTSGILIETANYAGATVSLIGIGINVASAPAGIDRATTCLAAQGSTLDADTVLKLLAQRMDHWLDIWRGTNGFAAIRSAWVARAIPIGRALEIKTNDGLVAGTFAGLDHDGALLIDLAPDIRRRFTYGDVSVLPARQA